MERKSNFEFLKDNRQMASLYKPAKNIEDLYSHGNYDSAAVKMRKVSEKMAEVIAKISHIDLPPRATFDKHLRAISDAHAISPKVLQYFYDLKGVGNKSAHEFVNYSHDQALNYLKKFYAVTLWFANKYTHAGLHPDFSEPQAIPAYQPYEKKLIYVQSVPGAPTDWPLYQGSEKVGDATLNDPESDARPNSDDLRTAAANRIRQYMTTSGVPFQVDWAELAYSKTTKRYFRDYDVRNVMYRSGVKQNKKLTGEEWLLSDVETAKAAIAAVKAGQKSLDKLPTKEAVKIVLRPEQKDAINKTKKAFKHYDKMLWNAKMRFGKTLTALELIKEEKFKTVLIMTHRPVVSDSWFDDFGKMDMAAAGYRFGSKTKGEPIDTLAAGDMPFIYFASIQDLRGSKIFGGKVADKNEIFAEIPWDLIIVDEAHEGTQTKLAQNVLNKVQHENTKVLELSGTPFNLIDKYEDDQVYTWDYVMEQQAKVDWAQEHPDVPNPYEALPKVMMYTFDISEDFRAHHYEDLSDKAFNFKEFFRTDDNGKFIHEADVRRFLDIITTPDDTNHYPYSTKQFRDRLRHTLWILPGVKEANALEMLLKTHPVFGMDYKIVNVVRGDSRDDVTDASDSDLDKVRQAITDHPGRTRTITLTVRKLTTGVNVPEWTGILFLSNTNSATQYLQAAFRAQTPFTDEELGEKTTCFVFDFAPDRALTVMADSVRLATGVGKLTTNAQKKQMGDLLNFMPIIGQAGNGMRPYQVDTLLTKIKRVYAERAVRTGFDDDSIYSDELLKIQDADLAAFNDLKALVGTSAKEKRPVKVDVNHQGLTNEEYRKLQDTKKKKPKERTPEEKELIEREKQLKKQRRTMISILRAVSIRIPMMIYGMDMDFADDIKIDDFTNLVDDVSWAEFMPKGVTKAKFNQFVKFYDADVFIEAGRIIRRRVKALDGENPIERAKQLSLIFATFRNPDKETVLTPWRVVNMQCAKTIGGYNFYDDAFENTTKDGVDAAHWVATPYTKQVFKDDTHILEINAKTGLYPLYAAESLFVKKTKTVQQALGEITPAQANKIWRQILADNIFVIAKTPMAKHIAKRTLAGYTDAKTNIWYAGKIIENCKTNVTKEAQQVRRVFNIVKFDVVIGNPPYQTASQGESTRDEAIYHLFTELAYQLSDTVTLIMPARWLFNAGSTPKEWNKKMLNDPHTKVIMYEQNSDKIFPRTDIKGGVCIIMKDAHRNIGPIGIFTAFPELNSILKKVQPSLKNGCLVDIIFVQNKFRLDELNKDFPDKQRSDKRLESNIFSKYPIFTEEKESNDDIEIYGLIKNKRVIRYVNKKYIDLSHENLFKYKVLVPKSNGSGALGEVLSTPLIGEPLIGYTRSFIGIGNFNTLKEAQNLMKYVKSKFARTMLGVLKVTQDNNPDKWAKVPMQDFTSQSDIDWSVSVAEVDQQLYRKYDLSEDEINFIEEKVQAMV